MPNGTQNLLEKEFLTASQRASSRSEFAQTEVNKLLLNLGSEGEAMFWNIREKCWACLGDPCKLQLPNDEWFMNEFPQFVFEMSLGPISCEKSDPFRRLFFQGVERREIVRALVEEHSRQKQSGDQNDYRILDWGLMPASLSDLRRKTEFVSNLSPRYRVFLKKLGDQSGENYELFVPRYNSEVPIQVAGSPALAGMTAQDSANIQWHIDHCGLAEDLTAVFSFVFASFSCSPFFLDWVGQYGNRPMQWKYGMDPKGELTSFTRGSYYGVRGYEAFLMWLDYVRSGKEILTFEDIGKEPSEFGLFPHLKLRKSTRWTQASRLSWSDLDGKICTWSELRAADAQPTQIDKLALTMLHAGWVLYFLHGLNVGDLDSPVESAEELMPHDTAEFSFNQVLKHGLYETDSQKLKVRYRGKDEAVIDLIRDRFIPMAIEGLVAEGENRDWVTKVLAVLDRQLEHRMTGSYWGLDRLASKNTSDDLGIPKVMNDLVAIQADQSFDLDDPTGLVDIVRAS